MNQCADGAYHRHLAPDRTCPPVDRQGRAVRSARADHGRKRHRQRAGRTLAARQKQPRRGSVRRSQLRGHSLGADRKRTLRPRTRRLHLGHQAAKGQVRTGRRRHAVHGRDRRHVAGGAGQGVAGASGKQDQPRRQRQGHRGQRTRHRRHEQEPARGDPEGQFPRRPLPPHRGGRRARPGAARTCAGHPAAGRPFHTHNLCRIPHPGKTH